MWVYRIMLKLTGVGNVTNEKVQKIETQTTLRIKKDAVEISRTRNEESCLEESDTHIKY